MTLDLRLEALELRPWTILKRLMVAIVICLASSPLTAQWTLVSETPAESLGHGATQVTKKLKGPIELELSLVFFDSRSTSFRIIAQSTQDRAKARTLEDLAAGAGALAACNGGYFHPDFSSSGLEISREGRTGSWRNDLSFGGVLCVRSGEPLLVSDSGFKVDESVTDLIQCCPLLVQKSAALRGTGGPQLVARTFIATDGGHRWLIGFARHSTYEHLATALTDPVVLHELKVQTALNLDGGPSSGLWWKPAEGKAQGQRPATIVRNIIAIVPRKS
jgi:hypothetical protein